MRIISDMRHFSSRFRPRWSSWSLALLALAGLCAGRGPARADTPWSEFRGPTGDGVSHDAGLPVEWSETKVVAWKTPIPGKAWSSPVIADGVVWMTNATEDGKRLSAVAVDCASGKVLHDIALFAPAEPAFAHAFNSHASCTPVLEGNRFYAHFGSAGTACVDTGTGAILWKQETLRCDHHRGHGSSPTIHGDLLIVPFDGFDVQYVAALDKQSGDVVWKRERNIDYGTDDGDAKKAYGTGTVIHALGREQIVIPSAGATIAYDPSTGEELWRVNHGGMNASARPLFGNGLVYLNTAAGGMKTLAVRPEGSGDITGTAVAWTSPQGSGSRSSQLLLGERMFHVGDAGTATVLDALTGKAVWQKRLGGGILVVASRRGGEDLLPEPGGTDVRGDGGRAVRGDRREHARRGLHGIPGNVRRRALPVDEGAPLQDREERVSGEPGGNRPRRSPAAGAGT